MIMPTLMAPLIFMLHRDRMLSNLQEAVPWYLYGAQIKEETNLIERLLDLLDWILCAQESLWLWYI